MLRARALLAGGLLLLLALRLWREPGSSNSAVAAPQLLRTRPVAALLDDQDFVTRWRLPEAESFDYAAFVDRYVPAYFRARPRCSTNAP